MRKGIRKILAAFFSLLAIVMLVYVGGYRLVILPLKDIYHCYIENAWTLKRLFIDIIKIFFSATVGGGLWCLFDIIAGFFRDDD